MKFKKIKKRKVYETWQHKNRKTGLVSFIYCNPNGEYHWVVSCFVKRCGFEKCIRNEENCDQSVYYNSLSNGLVYKSFDECAEVVIRWHRFNKCDNRN